MRAVADTNIFVSAALKATSIPSTALHLIRKQGTLLKSAETERQLLEVLRRPSLSRLMAPAAFETVLALMAEAETVEIVERVAACRDPTDDKFLDLAVNGHADLILTGDKDLLVLHPFRGIPILPPAEFVLRLSH